MINTDDHHELKKKKQGSPSHWAWVRHRASRTGVLRGKVPVVLIDAFERYQSWVEPEVGRLNGQHTFNNCD